MKTVLVDFDGVIHSYVSGWKGKTEIPDPPNLGAIAWLRELIAHPEIEPVIWTSRVHIGFEDPSESETAKRAIRSWFYLHGMDREEVEQLRITSDKPPSVLLIDDRAFKFEGAFPLITYIEEFKP